MDNGYFNGAHPDIVLVEYVDPEVSTSGTDGLSNSDPDQVRGSISPSRNTSVIIGASVGALLVLGALVFYRRRRKSDELADATTQGDSNIV